MPVNQVKAIKWMCFRFLKELSTSRIVAILLSCIVANTHANSITIPGYENDDYFTELLRHSLSYFPNKNYQLQFFNYELPKNRVFELVVNNDGIDVVAAGATLERARQMRAVAIPLVKGLFGWRVPLIHKDSDDLFKNVNTLEQFKRLTPGQMRLWSDTKILRVNGIRVEQSSSYSGLFKMLHKQRFDYFPRSVLEIEGELATHADLKITIAEDVMLRYPTAYLFYVNKDNEELALDIEQGLLAAIDDGSYETIFQKHYGKAVNKIKQQNRKTFMLENPLLPDLVPVNDKKFWLSLSNRLVM